MEYNLGLIQERNKCTSVVINSIIKSKIISSKCKLIEEECRKETKLLSKD